MPVSFFEPTAGTNNKRDHQDILRDVSRLETEIQENKKLLQLNKDHLEKMYNFLSDQVHAHFKLQNMTNPSLEIQQKLIQIRQAIDIVQKGIIEHNPQQAINNLEKTISEKEYQLARLKFGSNTELIPVPVISSQSPSPFAP